MENNPLVISDQERLALLYERFRDVCLVEKEVWTEIYMPRQAEKGMAFLFVLAALMWTTRRDVNFGDLGTFPGWWRLFPVPEDDRTLLLWGPDSATLLPAARAMARSNLPLSAVEPIARHFSQRHHSCESGWKNEAWL